MLSQSGSVSADLAALWGFTPSPDDGIDYDESTPVGYLWSPSLVAEAQAFHPERASVFSSLGIEVVDPAAPIEEHWSTSEGDESEMNASGDDATEDDDEMWTFLGTNQLNSKEKESAAATNEAVQRSLDEFVMRSGPRLRSTPRDPACNRVWASAVSSGMFRHLESVFLMHGVEVCANYDDWQDGPGVEETMDIDEIALFKARELFALTGLPAVAERTSISVSPSGSGKADNKRRGDSSAATGFGRKAGHYFSKAIGNDKAEKLVWHLIFIFYARACPRSSIFRGARGLLLDHNPWSKQLCTVVHSCLIPSGRHARMRSTGRWRSWQALETRRDPLRTRRLWLTSTGPTRPSRWPSVRSQSALQTPTSRW